MYQALCRPFFTNTPAAGRWKLGEVFRFSNYVSLFPTCPFSGFSSWIRVFLLFSVRYQRFINYVSTVLSKSNSVTARNLFLAVYFWQMETIAPSRLSFEFRRFRNYFCFSFHTPAPPLCSSRVSSVTLLSASRALSISSSSSLSTLIRRDALRRSFNYALGRYAEGETNSKCGCLVKVFPRVTPRARRKARGFTPIPMMRW